MKHLLRFSVLVLALMLGGMLTAQAQGTVVDQVLSPVKKVFDAVGVEGVGISNDGVSIHGETGGVKWGYDSSGNYCGTSCGESGLIFPEDRPPSIAFATHSENSFRRVVVNIVNFILFFLGLVAMIMITYGGFLYLTAGGDDGQQGKAKSILLYAAIGIFVILSAFALSNTLLTSAEPDATGDPENVGYENRKAKKEE